MKLVEFQPSLWSIHLFWFDRSVLAALFPFYAAWYASRHTSCWWRPLLLRIPTTPSIDLCWFDRHPGAGSAWRLLCSFSAPSLLLLFSLCSFSSLSLLLCSFSAASLPAPRSSAPSLLLCSWSAPSLLLLFSFSVPFLLRKTEARAWDILAASSLQGEGADRPWHKRMCRKVGRAVATSKEECCSYKGHQKAKMKGKHRLKAQNVRKWSCVWKSSWLMIIKASCQNQRCNDPVQIMSATKVREAARKEKETCPRTCQTKTAQQTFDKMQNVQGETTISLSSTVKQAFLWLCAGSTCPFVDQLCSL